MATNPIIPTTTTTTTTKKHIFILAGQSNMAGRGGVHHRHFDGIIPPECLPDPSILRLTAGLHWEQAHVPLHADIDVKKTCGVCPGMPFARSVLPLLASGDVVGLVPCAVGGTAIKEWERGAKLYEKMVERARFALKGNGGDAVAVAEAVLWYQGESDTDSDHAAESYKGNVKRLVGDLRKDLGLPELPFIQVALASGTERNIQKVRQAQLSIDLPNVFTVDAMGLSLNEDHLHLTTESQVKLGKMLAMAYIEHFLKCSFKTRDNQIESLPEN